MILALNYWLITYISWQHCHLSSCKSQFVCEFFKNIEKHFETQNSWNFVLLIYGLGRQNANEESTPWNSTVSTFVAIWIITRRKNGGKRSNVSVPSNSEEGLGSSLKSCLRCNCLELDVIWNLFGIMKGVPPTASKRSCIFFFKYLPHIFLFSTSTNSLALEMFNLPKLMKRSGKPVQRCFRSFV